MNLLCLNPSIFGSSAKCYELTDHAVAGLLAKYPDAHLTNRDLDGSIDHLSLAEFEANSTPSSKRTPEQAQLAQFADLLIEELQAADVVVIGVPMYNFAMPTTLSSWFDRVLRAGVTFGYTESGPKGLLSDKRVLLCLTRGGTYLGSELDAQTPLLKTLTGFVGLTDVSFVYAEGLSQGVRSVDEIMDSARKQIIEWVQNTEAA